ncbi:MAG: glycoside hydrolase family 16 protein [Nakamurella sp.]
MSLLSVRPLRTAALAGVLGSLLLGVSPAVAAAAPILTSSGLTANVKGYEVTAVTTVRSNVSTTVEKFGVCVRGANKLNVDFVKAQNARVTPTGTTHTAKQTLAPGSYNYWTCAYDEGVWLTLDKARPFVVTVPDPTVVTTVDTKMPTGDLPGWKQVFTDDFTTDAAAGRFDDVYKNKFSSYHNFVDSFKAGTYNSDILSVKNGLLDMFLHTENGRPQVAAPAPIVTAPWQGQTYGKFSARFKSDALPGYKVAWLLWPDSNQWNEGEIDFPEGGLNSKMWGFNHCVDNPAKNCSWADTQVSFTGWHTVSIEWTPTRVTFLLDGQVVGNDTRNIPHTPMHWVLQTETSSPRPVTQNGHLQIDWVSVYTYVQ